MNLQICNKSGMALFGSLIAILVVSVLISFWLKSSDILRSTVQTETRMKGIIIDADDSFNRLKMALFERVNAIIQAKKLYDSLLASQGASTALALVKLQYSAISNFITIESMSTPLGIPAGMYSNLNFPAANKTNYWIECLKNCTTSPSIASFPKVFFVRLNKGWDAHPGEIATVSATLELAQGELKDYSSINFGAGRDQAEILIGAGSYGRTGIFWNMGELAANPNAVPPLPALTPKLKFVNPPSQTVTMDKLISNANLENIFFGDQSQAVGPVVIPGGMQLGAANPQGDLQVYTDSLIGLATTKKRSGSATYCDSKPITNADFFMECSSTGSCTFLLKEYNASGPCSTQIDVSTLNANAIVYSGAPVVNIKSNSSVGKIITGPENNFTFISDGKFIPTKSIARPSVVQGYGGKSGNYAFASRNSDGFYLNSSFQTVDGGTLGDIAGGAPLSATAIGAHFDLTSISMASGTASMRMDSNLLVPGAKYGTMVSDGGQWGVNSSVLRMKDPDSSSIISGFENIQRSFSPRWTQDPPAGINVQTSSNLAMNIGSKSITTESLGQGLEAVGLQWESAPVAVGSPMGSPENEGGSSGSGSSGTTTANEGTAWSGYNKSTILGPTVNNPMYDPPQVETSVD